MHKQLIFIDDSGDPGFKKTSSSHFVMAAVVFDRGKEATSLSEMISEYRKSFGWRDDYEFKFTKIRKDIIVKLLKVVSNYNFEIYAVYIDKKEIYKMAATMDKDRLYNWMIKELLLIIPMDDAKIEIDGRSSKQYMQRTATYLRRKINKGGKKSIKIKFADSVEDNLIQLADLVAGSINRSISAKKTDSNVYIRIIKNRICQLKKID